jgi:hypothetical protein
MSNDPFDHPTDTSYEDGKQMATWVIPADYLFAEAEDGTLIALGVCESDGLSDEELDELADRKCIEFEQRKMKRSGSQVVTNQADTPFDVEKLIEHLNGEGDD